jgi:hypothetical protein
MTFYLILLSRGKVVDINPFDSKELRDASATKFLTEMHGHSRYDEVQTLNEVH